MATFTAEQQEKLVEAKMKSVSFCNCTARYNGEPDPLKVKVFLSAITTFKSFGKISDEDAINAMPMLLEGDAAEWWLGVKSNAVTFDDVVRMLRNAFAPRRPAWRVYADILEDKQQKNETTDSFIRRKRALFALLLKPPAEEQQIDILFGMLNLQIRERLPYNEVYTFDKLLADAREAEQYIAERESVKKNTTSGGSMRCEDCRKKVNQTAVVEVPPKAVSKEPADMMTVFRGLNMTQKAPQQAPQLPQKSIF